MCDFVKRKIATNNSIFWNITQCSLLKVDRCFGGNIASILRVKQANQETSVEANADFLLVSFFDAEY
jgi:hypothetical protein